MGEDYGR
jgi:hypothetical protein